MIRPREAQSCRLDISTFEMIVRVFRTVEGGVRCGEVPPGSKIRGPVFVMQRGRGSRGVCEWRWTLNRDQNLVDDLVPQLARKR
jgi:hypothetical protein